MLLLLLRHVDLLQLLLRRVIDVAREGDTATLKLLLLTSFDAVATAMAYADASVARVGLLTAVIVRMLLLHIEKV